MADFVNQILTLEDSWIGYVVAALVAAVLILHVVAVGALLFIWMERKISCHSGPIGANTSRW